MTAVVAPLVFTVLWSCDAATDPEDQGLWPVGASGVMLVASLGAGFAALLGRLARDDE